MIKNTILAIIILAVFNSLNAQCDLELRDKWEKQLQEDGVTFIKDLSVLLKNVNNDTVKFSLHLNAGSKYRFYMFESDKYDGKGSIQLFEGNRLLGTNYIPATKKRYPYFDFKCQKNGVYHIFISKLEGKEYCAQGIIAFVEYFESDIKKVKERECDIYLIKEWFSSEKAVDVTYLADFPIMLTNPGENATFKKVLSKGVIYRLSFVESDKFNGKGKISLFKDNVLLGTNYINTTGKSHLYFDFKCQETGIYKIIIEMLEGEKYCAVGILSFVDKFKIEENVKIEDNNEEVFIMVDKMPQFVEGNDLNEFRKYLQANLNLVYPKEAKELKIEGRVFVYFVVSKEGIVKDAKVVRGVHALLDEVALKRVQDSPKWFKPGYIDNKPVNVAYTFPVVFNIK